MMKSGLWIFNMRILIISCLLAVSCMMVAQQTVIGQVIDANNGHPLPGVNFIIANTTQSMAFDETDSLNIQKLRKQVSDLSSTLPIEYEQKSQDINDQVRKLSAFIQSLQNFCKHIP